MALKTTADKWHEYEMWRQLDILVGRFKFADKPPGALCPREAVPDDSPLADYMIMRQGCFIRRSRQWGDWYFNPFAR